MSIYCEELNFLLCVYPSSDTKPQLVRKLQFQDVISAGDEIINCQYGRHCLEMSPL